MNASQFDRALTRLKHQKPFKPFSVDLTDGRIIAIDDPEGLAFAEGTAAFIHANGVVTFFDNSMVMRLPDAADSTAA